MKVWSLFEPLKSAYTFVTLALPLKVLQWVRFSRVPDDDSDREAFLGDDHVHGYDDDDDDEEEPLETDEVTSWAHIRGARALKIVKEQGYQ